MKKNPTLQNLVGRVTDRHSPESDSRTAKSRKLVTEALEPRILFSGSPAPAPEAAPAEAPAVQEAPAPEAAPAPAAEAPAEVAPVAAPPAATVPAPADAADQGDTAVALTDAELSSLTDAAAGIWAGSGISDDQSTALASATYQIADLGGNILGSYEGNLITIDDDAAGRGWFIDDTPLEGGAASTGIDLLSVLLHEQGHVLGLDDSGIASGDVMFEVFEEGERRLPEAGQAEGAIAGSLEGVHYATLITINNAGFEDATGNAGRGNLTTPTDWTEENAGSVYVDDNGTAWVPEASRTLYFGPGAVHQDLNHNWSSSDTFTVGLIAMNPTWSDNNNTFKVQLRQASDDTVLWDSGDQNVGGTVTNGPAYTGTDHIFSWDIDASTFTAGTEGEQINIRIEHVSDGPVYLDNVSLSVDTAPTGPDAVDDDYTTTNPTDEDTVLDISAPGVLANDIDTGATITAFDAVSAEGAAVIVNPDGSFSYDPTGSATLQALNGGDMVTDTFTYTISDGRGSTSITINNAGFEDATGNAGRGNLTTPADWTEENAGSVFVDDNGTAWVPEASRTLYFGPGAVHQDLNHNWSSSDTFTVGLIAMNPTWSDNNNTFKVQLRQASDDTVLWDSGDQNVGGTVTNGPAYTGTDHIFSWDIDASTFTAGTEGEQINIRIEHVSDGPVYLDNVSLDVTANAGTDTATVSIKVDGVDDLDAVDDDYTTSNPTDADTVLDISGPGVLANDNDTGATITAFDATSAEGATVTVNPDGSFTYDPTGSATLLALNGGDMVTDTFTYTISDGSGGGGATSITIDNAGFEDASGNAGRGNLTTPADWTEENAGSVFVDDNGTAWVPEASRTLYFGPGAVHQDLGHNWSSSDTFTLGLIAMNPTWSDNNNTFKVQLRQASDDTVLWDSGDQNVGGTVTGGPAYTGTGHIFSWDIDANTFTAGTEGEQINIWIGHVSDGPVYLDNVSLDVTANPGTDTATVSIKVNGVNTTDEDTPLTVPVDGTPAITAFDATSANGAAITMGTAGEFTYDPTAAADIQKLDDGDMLTDTFTYTISDQQSITIDNAGFEDASGNAGRGNLTTPTDWTEENAGSVFVDDNGTAWVPEASRTLYFGPGAVHQDLDHNWVSSDTFTLGLIAMNPTWSDNNNTFKVQLRQASDDTVLWDSGDQNVGGTVTSGPAYTGTDHIFSWDIDASAFTAGTEGEQINVRIEHVSNGPVYLDNVALAVAITETATVSIKVDGLNDAPVIAGANGFDPVAMDDVANMGQTVAALLDDGTLEGFVTDVDDISVEGIAITVASSSDPLAGKFQFDAGSGWMDVSPAGDEVSETNALLLRSTDKVRFLPTGMGSATGTLTFKAWDQSDSPTNEAGDKVTTLPDGGTDQTSAFSDDTATSNALIVNVIIEDGVLVIGEGLGRDDRVTISAAGGFVTIHDDAGTVSAADPAWQVDANTVTIPIGPLFEDIEFRANDGSDQITVGDMGSFSGSLTILGGDGFDDVVVANGASVSLGADKDLLVDGETFRADLDSSVSVSGGGTIDILAAGGSGDFAGLNLRRASLSSEGGGITLTGVGGDTGNTNDGVVLTHGSTVSAGGGSVTITGTATSTTGANDGISLKGGSDITSGAGGITLAGTSSGVNSSYGVQLFSGTEVTTAGGDIAIVGSSTAGGSRNAGIYTNGATVTAGGAGSVAMTGTGGGAGSNNNGLSLAATAVDAGTSGDVTLVGMGGGGTSGNGGVQVGTRTSVSADGGDVTITGTGGAGTGVRNTGVSLLSGSSVSSGVATSITGVAGTGTSRNGGVVLTSATVAAAGDLTVDGTGNGTGSNNSGISSSRSTLGGAEVTLAGTGSTSSSTGRFNDGVSISRGGVTASGTLTIDAAGGTGSRDNRGLMVSRAALGGTLAVTGSADPGSGSRSTGVFIQNSMLSDDGTIEGTGGAAGLGVYMRNITGGNALGVTTTPDTDDEKRGNFFDAVLPAFLLLGAGGRTKARRGAVGASVLDDELQGRIGAAWGGVHGEEEAADTLRTQSRLAAGLLG